LSSSPAVFTLARLIETSSNRQSSTFRHFDDEVLCYSCISCKRQTVDLLQCHHSSRISLFFVFFSFLCFFPVMLYYNYTLMFSLFTALLLCYCVSFSSLLDGVCLSGDKTITYLLTYVNKCYFSATF